jgi:hypothetical protein
VPPAALGRLFLGAGRVLRRSAPTASSAQTLTLRSGPLSFTRPVRLLSIIDGAPTVVFYDQLVTRRGRGTPKGSVTLRLLDCDGETCRTLSTGSTTIGSRPRGWQQRTVRMSSVSTLLLLGHQLRLSFSLQPKRNIDGLVIGFDARSTPSRLEIR